jgi:hypothetical protein
VTAGIDLGALAARSEGATQAFLKDWVHRVVQVATERLAARADKVELRIDDFELTLREARGSAGTTTRLIGFLGG